MNIVHFITGLNVGGAEMMLFKHLRTFSKKQNKLIVISLQDKSMIGKKIEKLGVRVFDLNLSYKSINFVKLINLFFILKKFNPDIFHCWMYHANLLGFLYSIFFRKTKVIWNIRQTLYSLQNEKKLTRLVIFVSKIISNFSINIIYNSKKSLKQHSAYGFRNTNSFFIPNGFIIENLNQNQKNKINKKIRKKFNIPERAIVIGIVARNHPMKGYDIFFKSLEAILEKRKDIHVLAVGRNVNYKNFKHVILKKNKSFYHFTGQKNNINDLMCCMNIFVSSSIWGEGFSNVLSEAMLMEVPCVATNIGESKNIIGKNGIIIEANSSILLEQGILKILALSSKKRKEIGRSARKRVISKFDIEKINKLYSNTYLT